MNKHDKHVDVQQALRQGDDSCLFDPSSHEDPSVDVVQQLLRDCLFDNNTSMADALLHRYASDALFSDHDFIIRLIQSSSNQDTEVLETLLYKSFQVCLFDQKLVQERVDACLEMPHLRDNPKFIYFLLDVLYPFDYASPALDRVCMHAVRHLPKNTELLISAIHFDCLEQFKTLGEYVDPLIWHEVLPHCCSPDDVEFFEHARHQISDSVQHPSPTTSQVFQQCLTSAALHNNVPLLDFLTQDHGKWSDQQWSWLEEAFDGFGRKWFKATPIHGSHFHQWCTAQLARRQMYAGLNLHPDNLQSDDNPSKM